MNKESVSLRFKQGSADKVYNATLEPKDGQGWVVNFAYGRYGKALRSGTKTALPIPYDRAKKAYDKLVTEKSAKGYTPDADGTPFTAPQIDQERTDLYPQLLNEVERDDLVEVFERFGGIVAMQFKHDGERRPIQVEEGIVIGSNRRALKVGMHPRVVLALQDLYTETYCDYTLDTEDMGARVEVFDVLAHGQFDLRGEPFSVRMEFLKELDQLLIEMYIDDVLRVDTPRVYTDVATCMLDINRAEEQGHEGVVLRDLRSQYSIGKPNSWGGCLKLKFWQSVTCLVESIHPTKRSIGICLWDNDTGDTQSVGNCTVPTNYPMPERTDLVEVKYLYAYRGGSIYQPQYKGIRTDLVSGAAVLSQLKYKE